MLVAALVAITTLLCSLLCAVQHVLSLITPISVAPGSSISVKLTSLASMLAGFALAFQCVDLSAATSSFLVRLIGAFDLLEEHCVMRYAGVHLSNCILKQYLYRMAVSLFATFLLMAVLTWIVSRSADLSWKDATIMFVGDTLGLHLACTLSFFLASARVSNGFFETGIKNLYGVVLPPWFFFSSITVIDTAYNIEDAVVYYDSTLPNLLSWRFARCMICFGSAVLCSGSLFAVRILWLTLKATFLHQIMAALVLLVACSALATLLASTTHQGSLLSFSLVLGYTALTLLWSLSGSNSSCLMTTKWRRIRSFTQLIHWTITAVYFCSRNVARQTHQQSSPLSSSSPSQPGFRPNARLCTAHNDSFSQNAASRPSICFATWYLIASILTFQLTATLTDWGYHPVDLWFPNVYKTGNHNIQSPQLTPPILPSFVWYCTASLPTIALYQWSLVAPYFLKNRIF